MNERSLLNRFRKTEIYSAVLITILCVSLGMFLIPKAMAYLSGPMQSGTVTSSTGITKAASFGTVCRYDASSGSVDPYFFPAMETHSRSTPYPVIQIAQLKITVTGTKPNGQAVGGLEFTDLAYLDSPHDSGSEWYYALTDIYNTIVDLLPQPASALLKNGFPSPESGVHYDSTSAWGVWNWPAYFAPFMYNKGLQFRFKLHCDPSLEGYYTIKVKYHMILYQQNRPNGPGFTVYDNDVSSDTILYYYTPPIGQMQLREFDYASSYDPNIAFSKPTSEVLRIDSYSGGSYSIGRGYAFFKIRRDMVAGNIIRVYWNVYHSYPDSRDLDLGTVYVFDAVFDRKDMVSYFKPNQNREPIFDYTNVKAVQYPFQHVAGWSGWFTTTSPILSLSGWSSTYVTIVIRMVDSWVADTTILDVDYLQILNPSYNILNDFQFRGNVAMETAGTLNDYGLVT